jgi:flavin reductase (DIM6/NTAB) family NADH-FMN oxidoreductase RutF
VTPNLPAGMKKIVTDLKTFQYFYPYTVAVVGARVEEETNYMSCAWHTALSFDPPLFGILVSAKRRTHGFITQAGEFTVNFLERGDALLSARMGRVSGHDRDKVHEFAVELEPARNIRTPVLAAAYAAFECRLHEVRSYGDHDLFVGEVLTVQVNEGSFDANGVLNTRDVKPLLYMGCDLYLTVDPDTLEHKLPE